MNEVWIKPRTDGFPGTGTQADPFNGSNPDRLDPLLRSLPANYVIHFGPGLYRTFGYHPGEADPSKIWQLKPGWKLLGSGIGISVLQLVDNQFEDRGVSVVGSEYNANADYAAISGFTFDCNVDGQSNGKKVINQAVGVFGSHIKLIDCKAIGWGTLCADKKNPIECFVFCVNGGHPDVGPKEGNIMQDCFATDPTPHMADAGASVFCVFGAAEEILFHNAPSIRGCHVHGGKSQQVKAFSMSGVRNGRVVDCTAQNCATGYYADTGFNDGLVVEGCRFTDVLVGVGFNYGARVETRFIEQRVELLRNSISLRDENAIGVSFYGADSGPPSFRSVKISDNRITPIGSPRNIAGIDIHNAGDVTVTDNEIALPLANRRFHPTRVRSLRLVDTFYEGTK